MRTTITLADDVAVAVEQLRRKDDIGISEAVNRLVRRGLATPPPRRKPVRLPTARLGLTLSVDNVAEVLDQLDDLPAR